MPPSRQAAPSRLSSRSSNVVSLSSSNGDASLVKAGVHLPKIKINVEIVIIIILLIALVICAFIITCKFQPRLHRRYDVEAIRDNRQRIRARTRGARPHHIGASDELQRKVTRMVSEGEAEARIDWEPRQDPLYVRTEAEEARRQARRLSLHPDRNAEHSSRKSSLELSPPFNTLSPPFDTGRMPAFSLIQSGNSRSERFPSLAKPADSRKATTNSKTYYHLEDKHGQGYFDTTGYMDENGQPHVWKGRRTGERISSYEEAQRAPAFKSHSYASQSNAPQRGESSRTGAERFGSQANSGHYGKSSSVVSPSPEKGRSAPANYGAISPEISPPAQSQHGPRRQSTIRSPSKAIRLRPSHIPKLANSSQAPPLVRYTSFGMNSTTIDSPNTFASPKNAKSPASPGSTGSTESSSSSDGSPIRGIRFAGTRAANALTPLLGGRRPVSTASTRTVVRRGENSDN